MKLIVPKVKQFAPHYLNYLNADEKKEVDSGHALSTELMEKLKTKVRPFLTVLQGLFNGDEKDDIMKCFSGSSNLRTCGEVEGVRRNAGDAWPAADGCNTCRCIETQAVCTEKHCQNAPSPKEKAR